MSDQNSTLPDNAGRHVGGSVSIGWSGSEASPAPRKKTLEFEHLRVTYDIEKKMLTVEDDDLEFNFSEETLKELKSALVTLGIGISSGNQVHYR